MALITVIWLVVCKTIGYLQEDKTDQLAKPSQARQRSWPGPGPGPVLNNFVFCFCTPSRWTFLMGWFILLDSCRAGPYIDTTRKFSQVGFPPSLSSTPARRSYMMIQPFCTFSDDSTLYSSPYERKKPFIQNRYSDKSACSWLFPLCLGLV